MRKPNVAAIDRGFGGALVLLALVLTLFIAARFIGRDRSSRVRRRPLRRIVNALPTRKSKNA